MNGSPDGREEGANSCTTRQEKFAMNRKQVTLAQNVLREALVGAQLGLVFAIALVLMDPAGIRENLLLARHPTLELAALVLILSAAFALGMAATGLIFIRQEKQKKRSRWPH